MQKAFNHSTKKRKLTDSIIVEITSSEGTKGWGEGAPRSYVSGETLNTAINTLKCFDFKYLNSIIRWNKFEEGGKDIFEQNWLHLINKKFFSPAAAAAVEIACIDMLCKMHSRRISDFLNLFLFKRNHPIQQQIPVSFVIDLSVSAKTVLSSLSSETLKQLHCVKIKAHRCIESSVLTLKEVKSLLYPHTYVSIDVNGVWNIPEIEDFAKDLDLVSWIEEPIRPKKWSQLAKLRAKHNFQIMLDESFANEKDIHRAVKYGSCDLMNVRISKCGGITASVKLIRRIRQVGLKYQLGVHVGEIGPLWAASRAVAFALDDYITIEAGKQDEWFSKALTEPPFKIDRKKSAIEYLPNIDLGLRPSPYLLARLKKIADMSI